MAILKCKMCGGDIELSADKTFGTCDSCGSTMTFPKVDDEQRANMFNRGNHFRRQGEFDKALAVYERIVQEDENDAEAHWCCALCRFGIEYVEDPNTYEYLPTCHRASFDSFLEDVDYLAALEHSDGITRRQYQKDAAKIAEVQRGILATSQNEEPFDVFICYKESENDGTRTRDSLLAQEIYYQLTEQGRRVFFSRITLEDKAGTEYEPYIFAALNSAKVMIVVTTSAEHVNAVWVKNEWSRFLSLMRKDRSKLLLPCYRDMDPYDLPEALSVLQSYDMGKIGFIQDLTRGVNKVLDASKPKTKEPVKETVVIQQQAQGNVAPLLKRAFMFLEDGDFARADEFCEQVLNLDPENAEAYLGKLMAELRVRTPDALKDQPEPFDDSNNYKKAYRFGDEKRKEKLSGDIAFITERNETTRKESIYQNALATIREQTEEGYRKATKSFSMIPDYKNAVELQRECEVKAEEMYQNNLQRLNLIREINRKVTGFISAGSLHTVCVNIFGKVRAIGDKATDRCNVSGWKDVVAVSAGTNHTIGLCKNGTVFSTAMKKGQGLEGEEENWNDIIAISAASGYSIGLKSNGTVVATEYLGDPKYNVGQCDVASWTDIDCVSAAAGVSVGLKSDGTVVAAGGTDKIRTGVSEWKNIVAISVGTEHVVGLHADGTVVAAGSNHSGQCEVSEWRDITAISAGTYHTVGVRADGSVIATKYCGFPKENHGQCNVSAWRNIIAVSAGRTHTVGLLSDGTMVSTAYTGDQSRNRGQCDIPVSWRLFKNIDTLDDELREIEERRRQWGKLCSEKTIEQSEKKQQLEHEISDTQKHKQAATMELANLKGLFSGKRRKELEEQIAEDSKKIERLQAELKALQ